MINFLKISNRIKLGDYLHSNGVIDNTASNDIIGVCVISSSFLPDGKARFISMAAMDSKDKERGNYTKDPWVAWQFNKGRHLLKDSVTVLRNKVPIDSDSDGIIDGYSPSGFLPLLNNSNSYLTITNPQDQGTKYYYRTTNRIPSPYAQDGSFNHNFHYRGSSRDEWALTDYRGDLNTRDIVYSINPEEEYCQAPYCCERFSPGYRDHEWYLPAIGELAFIPPRFDYIVSKMQEAITAGSPGIVLSNYIYWSSSESDNKYAWYIGLKFGTVNSALEEIYAHVRAFLAV